MRLILHVGLHRAASSALQRLLTQERKALRGEGLLAITNRQYRLPAAAPVKAFARQGSAAEGSRSFDEFSRYIRRAFRRHDTVLISDENLLGFMPGKVRTPFSRTELLCSCLRALPARFDTHVVLILREHTSWLESVYKFRVGRGDLRTFPEFQKALGLSAAPFSELSGRLGDAVGRGRLTVGSYESIARDSGADILATLARLAGKPQLAKLRLGLVNTSPPPFLFEVIRGLSFRGIALPGDQRQKLTALAGTPGESGRETLVGELADIIADHGVLLPPQLRGRRSRTTRWVRDLDRLGILRPAHGEAAAMLADALARAEAGALEPVVPFWLRLELWARFAADREAMAARYLPEWHRLEPPGEPERQRLGQLA